MSSVVINRVSTQDARFQLKPGEGVDAIHTNPQYAYAVAHLHTDGPLAGVGLALTLGEGTDMILLLPIAALNDAQASGADDQTLYQAAAMYGATPPGVAPYVSGRAGFARGADWVAYSHTDRMHC